MTDENGKDDASYHEILRQIYRSLGRVESAIDEIKENAKEATFERDRRLSELTKQQMELSDQHKADNQQAVIVQKEMVSQITGIASSVSNISDKVDSQDLRIAAIEAPIKKAVAARTARARELRSAWGKIVTVASFIGAIVGMMIEPLWREFAAHWISATFGGYFN